MLDSLDLFLSTTQSDWSFDQNSLGLGCESEYNSSYVLKSSGSGRFWETVMGDNNASGGSNNGGGPSNNGGGGGPSNNGGGGGPPNNGGGGPNNGGDRPYGAHSNVSHVNRLTSNANQVTEVWEDSNRLANYLEEGGINNDKLRSRGIIFNTRYGGSNIDSEMSKCAQTVRKFDKDSKIFDFSKPGETRVNDLLIEKLRGLPWNY